MAPTALLCHAHEPIEPRRLAEFTVNNAFAKALDQSLVVFVKAGCYLFFSKALGQHFLTRKLVIFMHGLAFVIGVQPPVRTTLKFFVLARDHVLLRHGQLKVINHLSRQEDYLHGTFCRDTLINSLCAKLIVKVGGVFITTYLHFESAVERLAAT